MRSHLWATSAHFETLERRALLSLAIAVEEFRVNGITAPQQSNAAIAMDADGDFVIAWESFAQEGPAVSFGMFAQRFSASGVAQGNEFRVNTFATANQMDPAVAMDADGDFVV